MMTDVSSPVPLVATPNNNYYPNWREMIIRRWIVPELLPLWTNTEEIFDDKPRDDDEDDEVK